MAHQVILYEGPAVINGHAVRVKLWIDISVAQQRISGSTGDTVLPLSPGTLVQGEVLENFDPAKLETYGTPKMEWKVRFIDSNNRKRFSIEPIKTPKGS